MREVQGLQLDDAQWMDLLQARTSHGALDALQSSLITQQEYSATEALTNAWSVLEEKYRTPQRPAQQLLHHLLQGPVITTDEPEQLYTFATSCEAAIYMKQRDSPGFASLDEYTTQETVFARLSEALYGKWCEHRWTVLQAELVPFEQFARWIKGQAMIHRQRRTGLQHQTIATTPHPRESSTSAQSNHSQPHRSQCNELPGAESDPTSYSPTRNNSPRRRQSDHTPTYTPAAEGVYATSLTTKALPPQIRPKPSIPTQVCAWCTANNRRHSHVIADCQNFRNATQHDRWKVANKHRICKTCLIDAHPLSQCPMKGRHQRCVECNYA